MSYVCICASMRMQFSERSWHWHFYTFNLSMYVLYICYLIYSYIYMESLLCPGAEHILYFIYFFFSFFFVVCYLFKSSASHRRNWQYANDWNDDQHIDVILPQFCCHIHVWCIHTHNALKFKILFANSCLHLIQYSHYFQYSIYDECIRMRIVQHEVWKWWEKKISHQQFEMEKQVDGINFSTRTQHQQIYFINWIHSYYTHIINGLRSTH